LDLIRAEATSPAGRIANALKSGADPAFRLVCQNSPVPVTGYFPPGCHFAAHADASGGCTTVAYTYREPETYGGPYTQVCVQGVADGDNSTEERLIYGADGAVCDNETTGCDTAYEHWSGSGSLWVR
jgi:hypothetical protein